MILHCPMFPVVTHLLPTKKGGAQSTKEHPPARQASWEESTALFNLHVLNAFKSRDERCLPESFFEATWLLSSDFSRGIYGIPNPTEKACSWGIGPFVCHFSKQKTKLQLDRIRLIIFTKTNRLIFSGHTIDVH